mgnify:FL=1
MLFEEKEANLLDDLRLVFPQEIFLVNDDKETVEVFNSIYDESEWKEWTDASSKDAPPPDFYSDTQHLMLEVMRVDDHGFKKKGKVRNPNYERQHKLEKELRDLGVMDAYPNLQHIVINAVTDLPTLEDHNYRYYRDNFVRTVEHHKQRISLYRKNHPGSKLIFFVYDESSAYFEAERETNVFSNEGEAGTPHAWFFDKAFLDVFIGSDIDYFVWFTPYKHFQHIEPPVSLPRVCVYRCNSMTYESIEYKPSHMVSSEA